MAVWTRLESTPPRKTSFTVTTGLKIESDINKEYACSDHFFVITSTSSFGTWRWSTQPDRIKIAWDCDTLRIYHPTSEIDAVSASYTTHHITITYTTSSISVTTDIDSVSLSVSGTYWEEVWLWMGADDDEDRGSDFNNNKVYPCIS